MARPLRVPSLPTDPSRTLRRAGGLQVTATALRPSTGIVNCKDDNYEQVPVSTASVVQDHIRLPRPQVQPKLVKIEQDFSPALEEKVPQRNPISATISSTLRTAEGLQVTVPINFRPSTGRVKGNDNQFPVFGNSTASVVQDPIRRPPRPQLPARKRKTEQDFTPALGEKLPPETPIAATVSSTFPGAKDLQATAPAVWPSTLAPAKEELGHGPGGRITLYDLLLQRERTRLAKANQDVSPAGPASASISTATVAAAGKKPRAPRGLKLSHADLVSDAQLLLKEKTEKLGVSLSLFKNRRKTACLGRWPGRQVRAEMNRAQA